MAKGYLHVEIESSQLPRKAGGPSGDVVVYERSATSTTLVVCDGIGHGIKAHIAAQMCVARMLELIREGYSNRRAFESLVTTMEEAKGTDMPYAVFTLARIQSDGLASILTYEMPPPVLVTPRYAQVLQQRKAPIANCLTGEANCHLAHGEGIVIVSDGITQAGLGRGLVHGWTIEGASDFMHNCLSTGVKVVDLPKCVLQQARDTWGKTLGDDCSAVLARCRWGKTVNILTGPPADRTHDREIVSKFMLMGGTKVICGGTTAQMVARILDKPLVMEEIPQSLLAPPTSTIEGIDLVTEGAVTLNQLYNVLDEDASTFDEESGVTQLHELLTTADRIRILIGSALNPATGHVSFRQRGVLPRQTILPLIAERLQATGKLVVMERV